MNPAVILRLFSGELVIENSHPGIEHELHYWHRHLVEDPKIMGNRIQIREQVRLFNVLQEAGPRRIMTFQGFVDRIIQVCQKCSLDYQVLDHRVPFPGPQLKLTSGFRGSQLLVFMQLLRANRSGILKAPTRWGKSTCILNALRAFPGLRSVLLAPETGLLRQLVKELQAGLPGREVRGIFTGSKGKKESEDITVVSMDSLHKITHDEVRLVLVDEPHAQAAAGRIMEFTKFKHARILGFGASTSGRFDGSDKLIEGLIGPVLVEKTFREAVAEKMICPIVVYMLRVPFDQFPSRHRQHAYNKLMYNCDNFPRLVADIAEQVIPPDWQTVIFIAEARQGDQVQARMVQPCEIAVADRMSNQERQDRFEAMARGEIKRCAATRIYSTGVTFPHLRCIINATGGGGSITGTQKPGRLAQNRPGKKAGYMVDFLFECNQDQKDGAEEGNAAQSLLEARAAGKYERDSHKPGWQAVVKDSQNRVKTYKKLGYDVRFVNNLSEIVLE